MRSRSLEGILFVSYMFTINKCNIQNFTQNTDFSASLENAKGLQFHRKKPVVWTWKS